MKTPLSCPHCEQTQDFLHIKGRLFTCTICGWNVENPIDKLVRREWLSLPHDRKAISILAERYGVSGTTIRNYIKGAK